MAMWRKPEIESSGVVNSGQSAGYSIGVTKAREVTPSVRATIGASIIIKGEISGNEDLQIDGAVEGHISLTEHSVTVGKSGSVIADIHAKFIYVEGELTGDLYGIEQVVVHRTGRVRGNITAPRVCLEDGAKLKGTIDMDPKPGIGVAE